MTSTERISTDKRVHDEAEDVVVEAFRGIGEVHVPPAIARDIRRLVAREERVARGWQGKWLFIVPCIEVAVLALLRVGPDLAADVAGSATFWFRELLWLPISGAFTAVINCCLAACHLAAGPVAGTADSAWAAGVLVAAAVAAAVIVRMERVDG